MKAFRLLFFKSVSINDEDIKTLIDIMILIRESSISPGALFQAFPAISLKMAPLFSCPPHVINGIFSLIHGDY